MVQRKAQGSWAHDETHCDADAKSHKKYKIQDEECFAYGHQAIKLEGLLGHQRGHRTRGHRALEP